MAVLVKAKIDYADEFYCEAFKVYDSLEEWEEYKSSVCIFLQEKGIWEYESYFGTNEYLRIEHDTFSKHYDFEIAEISVDEAAFLNKHFKWFGTGHSAIFEIGM